MLRALVVALLIANVGFYAWSQGWLDRVVGIPARGDREPERLAKQVRPETVIVLGRGARNGGAAPAACLEAGPFNATEIAGAQTALRAALQSGSTGVAGDSGWTDVSTEKPGAWLVYMGAYPDHETLLRKIDEIRRVSTPFEEVAVPGEGAFGLSLGRFDDRSLAERALGQAQQRGIRTARVVQTSPPTTTHMLRFEHADEALAQRLASVSNEALGKGFVTCAQKTQAAASGIGLSR